MGVPSSSLLSGYRVLDIATAKGAFCGKLLRDLGTEVIKVEPPGGDPLRSEPPFAKGHTHREGSLRFAYLNAGKRSITLDLSRPAGRSIFLDLAKRSDVIVESYKPGALEELNLGYGVLREHQPKLILVSLTGFGQTGPYAAYASNDMVGAALGGLLYISGDPKLTPCMPPETQAYYYASIYAAYGVMLALWQRETRGAGVHIDASIQASMALHEHVAFNFSSEGRVMKRAGSQHQHNAPANLFPCQDGYISLFVTQNHWPIFLKVWEDHPPELDDPRWKINMERRANADWINSLVSSFTSRYKKEELSDLLQKNGIPALAVNSPTDFLMDSHINERGFFASVNHPVMGTYRQASAPLVIDGKRPDAAPAPMLGQHNDEIYCGELGLQNGEIEVLAAEGII